MINNHNVYIIAAVDKDLGIGRDGDLAWHFKKELAHFSETTKTTSDPDKQNMIVMGRTTWESLPPKFRPLPGRVNAVLTRKADYVSEGATIFSSLDDALAAADDTIESVFIAGGASVYAQAMTHEAVDAMYLTRIRQSYDCDVHFPDIPEDLFSHVEPLGYDIEKDIKFDYYLFTK
jgi:dihydrofolate reductase